MIKFATVGTNFIVSQFLGESIKNSNLEYVAAYSRDKNKADKFANDYGAKRGCSNLEELTYSDIDAVYIASPNALHYSQAAFLMKSKKHILCEKTVTSNSIEINNLISIALKNNVVFLEGIRLAYDPALMIIKNSLYKLGSIRNVTFQYAKYSSRYDKYKLGVIENAFNPKLSNGALMDLGIYCVFPMVSLFGKPESIQASSVFLSNGVDGCGSVIADYKNMQVRLNYSKITNGYNVSEIQGENASMIIDKIPNPQNVSVYYRNGRIETILERECKLNMSYEINEWVKLINGNMYHHKYLDLMQLEMLIMDTIREKNNIVFPADYVSEGIK